MSQASTCGSESKAGLQVGGQVPALGPLSGTGSEACAFRGQRLSVNELKQVNLRPFVGIRRQLV